MIDVLAAVSFRPEIAGILTVMVGVVVLMGSVYLLLATNTGIRLGFLLALGGFFGWMFIMGVVWTIYGIGYKGPDPTWHIDEIVFGSMDQSANEDAQLLGDEDPALVAALVAADPDASALAGSQVPKSLSDVSGINPWLVEQVVSDEGADLLVTDDGTVVGYVDADGNWVSGDPALSFADGELVDETGNGVAVSVETYQHDTGGWHVVEGADPFRGEAQAAADAALVEFVPDLEATDYVALGTFDLGGKPGASGDGLWDGVANKITNAVRPTHPPHYAVVQVAMVEPQTAEPGQPPPLPIIDSDAEVISVVMTRDLGSLRLPSIVMTLFSLTMLLLISWMLHARDERVADQARLEPGKS